VADLKRRVHAAILYISHDLAVIAQISDRVGILYAGELVGPRPSPASSGSLRTPTPSVSCERYAISTASTALRR